MAAELPQSQFVALQQLAARFVDSRKVGTELGSLARDLLGGFFDICTRAGLDGMLGELSATDRSALAETKPVFEALVAQLDAIEIDGGAPRHGKPRQLADCVVAALGLTVVEEPDRSISLGADVRTEVAAAVTAIVDAELAVPKIRETVIAEARRRCAENYHPAFTKLVAVLDDRGLQLVKLPKVPIDALHAVQRALSEARTAIIERTATAAIERAIAVIGRASPEATARLDQPVTLRSTPRELAILRACEPHVGDTAGKLAHSLLESLTELLRITWRVAEQQAVTYAASKTFAVGDLIEHPKFGRGSVVSSFAQRIEVEFADGKHTLIHVPTRK